jgi:glycosyltransferase involved in cell wall biosynthesis
MLDIGIPSAMLAETARRSRQAGALKVLWVGRLVPRKALLLALEAVARVDRRIDIHCTIVGDGPQRRYLRDWVRQLHLGDRVEWLGQVNWEVAMRLYALHDVFLFTSLRDTGGTQLIEAMANGLPIITLDHQGARVAVPAEAGVKIPVTTARRTVRKLAHALERLAEEPATIAHMGNAARLAAAAHTWGRKAASMSELYASVVAASNRQHRRVTLGNRAWRQSVS